ncbi:MAG: caspase family protein [Nostoc sp. ChiQUE01a]|nr:caspase family protein [Nostoc sp. ChiQUE01a]
MQWEENKTNFDRNLAVVIGINSYNSNGIHDLKTAVGDASAIADILEKEYAYKQTDIIRLFDDKATLTGLEDLLSKTIPNQLKPTSGDRLIFYYAGHGIPRNSKDGPAGYLVPQNADLNKADSFLSMQYVYEQLSQLPCHHLLVILDCCFAGTFQWAGTRKLIPILETVRREHYDRFIRFPAWQVITSSAHDQEAMDIALDNVVLAEDKRGTVTNSSHSPFALGLIEGLQNNRADLIPDGVITAHELYLYLEQRVSELSKERQNPGLYPLRREYDRGEFIFTKPEFTRDQLKAAPPLDENNNPYRGLKSFDEKHAQFFFGRQVLIEELVKRLLVPNQPLAVVLGVSGSGKSSLVKAGLIPYLRDKQPNQWYILDPMRPGELPFKSLARVLLPVVNASLLEQLSQVSFLDEALKQILESRTQADGDLGSTAQAKPESDRTLQINETLIKVAQSWCSATPEAKLLLIEDYLTQLKTLCPPGQQQLLVRLYEEILATLNSLLGHLQQNPQDLIAAIKTWSQNHPNIKLLLVIDQFEELITASHEDSRESDRTGGGRTTQPKQCQPFLEMLRGAIAACPHQWRVVLTLRSDFEPRFLDSPLKSYWKDGRFPVRAMNSNELTDAIEGPALKQALYFEPQELVGKLIDEVGQMPGALPLLSFTLSELYIKLTKRWREDPNSSDRALGIQDYEELGGVAGALTRRATEEYDNLVRDFGEASGKAYQATMRGVMLRMVTIEGGGVARRRVPESELVYLDPEQNERVRLVSDRLVKARLLVKGQETGEPYVEPAHDFLVRGWNKLQNWLQQEQEYLVLRQRLTPAAKDWDEGKGTGGLWSREAERLPQLERVLASNDNCFNDLETKFINESKTQRLRELAEAQRQRDEAMKGQIEALTALSEARFNDNQLGALISGLKAGRKFQQLKQLKGTQWSEQDSLTRDITVALLQNLARIQEYNCLQIGRVTKVAFSPVKLAMPKKFEDGTVAWQLIDYSPNEQLMLTEFQNGTQDGTVVWQLNGKPLEFWQNQYPLSIAIPSPDGQLIALSGEQMGMAKGTVILLHLDGTQQILPAHNNQLMQICFSPDSQFLATCSWEYEAKLWCITDGTCRILPGHNASVNAIAFSSDSQMVVTASVDSKVRLWNINGDLLSPAFEGHRDAVWSVSISPDGKTIASGGQDTTIKLWRQDGTLLKTLTGHKGAVRVLQFSSDGQILASGSDDGAVKLWKLSGTSLKILDNHTDVVYAARFSPDCQTIITTSGHGFVQVWQQDGTWLKTDQWQQYGAITNLVFSPDGKLIVSVAGDRTVVLTKADRLTTADGSCPSQLLKGHTGETELKEVLGVSFSPDSQWFALGDITGLIELWTSQGELIKCFAGHQGRIFDISISPDGEIIASAGEDKVIKLWKRDGTFLKSLEGHTQQVIAVCFSPDNQIIASSSADKTIKLWNSDGTEFKTLDQKNVVLTVSFSPDGQTLASADFDGTIKFWNREGTLLKTLYGHKAGIKKLDFNSDGTMLASASMDKSVILWDLRLNLELDGLLDYGCNWVQDYLNNNPQGQQERELCIPASHSRHDELYSYSRSHTG